MQFVLYIILAIIILLVMVLIHELGHYTAAKIFKFKVNEFSIGFGPKIFQKTKKNGEKITLRLLPLGGYCAFEGEDENGVEGEKSFYKEKPWKRIIVLLSGVLFNFLSAIIFSFIFLMAVGTASTSAVTVAAVTPRPPAAVIVDENGAVIDGEYYNDLKPGDVIYEINGVKISSSNSVSSIVNGILSDGDETNDDIFFTLTRDGVKQNIKVERTLIYEDTYMGFGFEYEAADETVTVSGFSFDDELGLYEDYGLQIGDIILKINDDVIKDSISLTNASNKVKEGESANFFIKRAGVEFAEPIKIRKEVRILYYEGFGFDVEPVAKSNNYRVLSVSLNPKTYVPYSELKPGDIITKVRGTPLTENETLVSLTTPLSLEQDVDFTVKRVNPETDKTEELAIPVKKTKITPAYEGFGFTQGTYFEKYGFGKALLHSVPFTFKMSWQILGEFGKLIIGKTPITNMTGPVGTITQIAEVSQTDWRNILILLPLLASNLAIFNLLPFPALDGLKVIFTTIEWIRKKPIKRKIENIIHLIGLIILLLFVVIVDIIGFVFRAGAGAGYLRL